MDNLENDLEKRALKKAAWTEKWRWGVWLWLSFWSA